MSDRDELVVYLMRIYHWGYHETVDLVRTLETKKLRKLIAETQLQEAQQHYREAENFAMICAVMVNLQSKDKMSIQDFIGEGPKKIKPRRESVIDAARKLGLQVPK